MRLVRFKGNPAGVICWGSLKRTRRLCAIAMLPATVLVLSGCAVGNQATQAASNATFGITPGIAYVDTNCTGCNARSARGAAVQQFSAVLARGGAASVVWSVSGGDATAGPGIIDSSGRYTPPSYLTSDHAQVMVTARLESNPAIVATARLTVTPGFLQPLSPENLAVGPGGSVTVTGRLAEVGGPGKIRFTLSDSAQDSFGGQGTLGVTNCLQGEQAFTVCSVTYNAPAEVSGTAVTYVVASMAGSRTFAQILLNSTGVNSNPTTHQTLQPTLMPLGSSGGNNNDYDARGSTIADCCSGTLGALIQDNAGRQFILSNNHVLARSDHAQVGDSIVQPGLIDNNCTPNGDGPGTVPVAALSGWLPLKSADTNTDAAIAQVGSHTVDDAGAILELGARKADGTLAAAAPGISSSGGKGESPRLSMQVAKSGRTTGLTCGRVSAIDLDVSVEYFRDCAETRPYLTKTFTRQMAISGTHFSDAGDSGALVVDAANAEPLGLFFAGGTDASGTVHAVATPAPEVLKELEAQAGDDAAFSFVGGADHGVSCLNYGNAGVESAQTVALSDAEIARGEQALHAARALVNPNAGILGVAMSKSSDHPGKAAVAVYVQDAAKAEPIPSTVNGVRTMVVVASERSVALGTAPLANAAFPAIDVAEGGVAHALQVKQQMARGLMRKTPAIFGVGVGQSLDDPREAALVIFVDRNRVPASLPATIGGLRTRYIEMDRLHVTRSYLTASPRHCMPHSMRRDNPAALLRQPKPIL